MSSSERKHIAAIADGGEAFQNKRPRNGEQRTLEASSNTHAWCNYNTDMVHQPQSQLVTALQQRGFYEKELEEMKTACEEQKKKFAFLEQWSILDFKILENGKYTKGSSYEEFVTASKICLFGVKIGDHEVQQISWAMQDPKCSVEWLLFFRHQGIVGSIAAMLRINTTLTTLILKSCELGDSDAKEIVAALLYNTTLCTLGLARNKITNIGAEALATALKVGSCSLTSLELSFNKIGSIGTGSIAKALLANTKLTVLLLCRVSCGDSGAQDLAAALRINKTLETLKLNGNTISTIGAKALAESLPFNIGLKKVLLMDNGIEEDGKQALEEARMFRATQVAHPEKKDMKLLELADVAQFNTKLLTLIL